jgi:hypothetical protein
MATRRKLSTRKSIAQKQTKLFDLKSFLASVGAGRTLLQYHSKEAVFSQGDRADAVFYIREGKVRLSVLSKQGKNVQGNRGYESLATDRAIRSVTIVIGALRLTVLACSRFPSPPALPRFE